MKIKKTYPNPDFPGQTIEIQGEQWEIEKFEKELEKKKKKNESRVGSKRLLTD